MFYTCLKIMSLPPLFGAVINHYQFGPNSWWCLNLQIVTDVLPVSISCWKVAKILNFVGFSTCPFSSADLCLMYFEAVIQCKCTWDCSVFRHCPFFMKSPLSPVYFFFLKAVLRITSQLFFYAVCMIYFFPITFILCL